MTAALALDLDPPARMTPPPASQPRATDGQLLAALPSAVGCARRFVRFTLERWRLFGLIATAEAVAAELVTDAVSATGIPVEHPGYLDLYDKQLNLVDLRVHLSDTHVVLLVWDSDPSPTRRRELALEPSRSRNFYLPQHGGKVEHRAACEEIIELLELEPFRHTHAGLLPYGVAKRAELGRALAMSPTLLLLDEPVAGMNVEETEDMARYLVEVRRELDLAMILVEHDTRLVMDLADRVLALDFGTPIATGSPEDIQRDPKVVEAYLGGAA